MLSFRVITSNLCRKPLNNIKPRVFSVDKSSSSSSSDSDDEKSKKKPKAKETIGTVKTQKNNEALNKLNLLLKKMVEEDVKETGKPILNLAKPNPDKRKKAKVVVRSEPIEKKLKDAARNVAEQIGGDKKQIESELLSKLLNSTETEKNVETKQPVTLSDLLIGMKIDRSAPASSNEASRAHQVRQMLNRDVPQRGDASVTNTMKRRSPRKFPKTQWKPTDLFGSEPLGIFTAAADSHDTTQLLKTWGYLQQRDLRLAVTHPPENYFQEMILWTEQQKIWRFPIDNEQGMGEERDVSFAEHVFLERHLQDWCPSKGPVRHFMELVCVGLSKNPYLSAQAKRDHVLWYRDYFHSKKDILQEVGAIPSDHAPPPSPPSV